MSTTTDRQTEFYEAHYKGERVYNRSAWLWRRVRRALNQDNPVKGILTARLTALLSAAAEGARALKVGCDRQTDLALLLATRAVHTHMIDLSSSAASDLARRLHERGASRFTAEGRDFMSLTEPYDLIYMPAVFHHLPDPDDGLRQLHRLLRPGGVAVLFEPLNSNVAMRAARGVANRFRNNADWERPLTLRWWKQHAPTAHIELYEGLTPLAWPLPGPLKRRAGAWLHRIERRLPRALDNLFLQAIIVIRG